MLKEIKNKLTQLPTAIKMIVIKKICFSCFALFVGALVLIFLKEYVPLIIAAGFSVLMIWDVLKLIFKGIYVHVAECVDVILPSITKKIIAKGLGINKLQKYPTVVLEYGNDTVKKQYEMKNYQSKRNQYISGNFYYIYSFSELVTDSSYICTEPYIIETPSV